MANKVVLFDFDGTLVDSFSTVVKVFNEIAPWFRCKTVDGNDLRRLREATSYQMMAEFGVTAWKLPFFMLVARRRMLRYMPGVQLHMGISEMLKRLHERDIRLCILTSNSVENVESFLADNGLDGIFSLVIAHKNLFGKHDALNKFIADNDTIADRVIYVGDETRDMEAAKRAHVTSVAVSWGFQAHDILATTKPDVICDDISSLERYLVKQAL